MEELLRRFLWWFYMTKNNLLSKWFSIKLDWLKWRYKGGDNVPKEELSKLLGKFSETETAVLIRHIRLASIITDVAKIRPMVQHGKFYKDLGVLITSEDLAERDDASSRIGYLFTTPLESCNATLEEMLACLVRYQELTEADVSYIKENLNYNSVPSTDLKGGN